MAEITKELPIINTLGLHARPAAQVVQTTLKFQSDVHISLNGHKVNAKSIMGLLTLAAARGSRLQVTCSGPDAEATMEALERLIASGFGEN